jgi:leucyl-tRNA synthetase
LTVGGVEKMSKSKRNVVDPDAIIAAYGADTARWFMLSDTPPERDIEWTEAGAEGSWRFIQRIWRIVGDVSALSMGELSDASAGLALRRQSHRSVAAIADDLNNLRFNRAIARIYELSNAIATALSDKDKIQSPILTGAIREATGFLILVMAPMMPHLAEECWNLLGNQSAVVNTPWPTVLDRFIVVDEVTIAIQVGGKRRDEILVPKGIDRAILESKVMQLESVKRALEGKQVKKLVVVPDRIVNIVVGD